MAIIPWHKEITKTVLKEFGFSNRACDMAAAANAKIDEKQGNTPNETHLHAMIGMVVDQSGRLIPEDRASAIASINALVENLKQNLILTINNILDINDQGTKQSTADSIVKKLGEVLHTVQDREFHNFGVWRHDGICSAMLHEPIDFTMHGVHDLGVMDLTIEGASGRYGRYGISSEIGVSPFRWMAEHNIFFEVQAAYLSGGGQPNDLTCILGLRFGGGGPTRMRPSAYQRGPIGFPIPSGAGSMLSLRDLEIQGRVSSEPVNNVLNRAERASRDFVDQVSRETKTLRIPFNKSPWMELLRVA